MKIQKEAVISYFCIFNFAFLIASATLAADLQISASLDRNQIAMNEQAVLSVVVSGGSSSLPDPDMPVLADFQIYNAGRAQNFSWINGQTSASVTHSYVLTPKQTGRFTIPPIRVQSHGQTAQIEPLTLDVVKGTPSALPGRSENSSRELFITAAVDKHSAYVGEPITLSFRLYNRLNFLRQPQYQPPDTSGFWTEDLPPQRSYTATVKGISYQVTEVRTALFPTASGKAAVGPATLQVFLESISSDSSRQDFFSSFFSGGEQKILRTDPMIIHVKPLPDPKPAGFKGAVGRYALAVALDKNSTTVGQPLTLTVTVSGEGYIKSIPNISLPSLTHFRTFDANAATNIEKKNYQVRGSKVFKTVLIPTTAGRLTIPSISFAYFDPAAQNYGTLQSKPLAVQVEPAPPGSSPPLPVPPGTSGPAPEIRVLNEDIRYMKTPALIASQPAPLYQRKGFRWSLLFLFGCVLASGLIPLYRKLAFSNPALTRFRQARAKALVQIKKAESAGRLSKALQDYLADKLGTPSLGISLKEAISRLQSRGIPAGRIHEARALWETLDLFQFAPAQVKVEELQKAAQDLRDLIGRLEKEIKWVEN